MEDLLLKKYTDYLDSLRDSKSSEIFTNGGKEYASELMSRLFDCTQKEARIYCKGFRGELICRSPYWESLQNYLKDRDKNLKVMVESGDYMSEQPIQLLLQTIKERGDDSVQLRLILDKDRKSIEKELSDRDCNFAVFDNNMFRFEYDPEGFRAFGSFNDPGKSTYLRKLFDDAFDQAMRLPVNESAEA